MSNWAQQGALIVPGYRVNDNPKPRARIRVWDADTERYPNRTPIEWVQLAREARERRGITLASEVENVAVDAGQIVLARFLANQLAAYHGGGWVKQAIGCGRTPEVHTDADLESYLYRNNFTEFIQSPTSLRNIIANTFFTALEFACVDTTVSAAPAPTTTTFTVAAPGNMQAGDLVRVALPTGFEFRAIGSIVAGAVTLAALDPTEAAYTMQNRTTGPLSAAPTTGMQVCQIVNECAVYGDRAAGYTTGTVTFTNGSTAVAGVGGMTWLTKVGPGDKIQLAGSRKWYTIATVNTDTSITLASPYAETTAAGASYALRGTSYNHATGLRWLKTSLRGGVVETAWELGGG